MLIGGVIFMFILSWRLAMVGRIFLLIYLLHSDIFTLSRRFDKKKRTTRWYF